MDDGESRKNSWIPKSFTRFIRELHPLPPLPWSFSAVVLNYCEHTRVMMRQLDMLGRDADSFNLPVEFLTRLPVSRFRRMNVSALLSAFFYTNRTRSVSTRPSSCLPPYYREVENSTTPTLFQAFADLSLITFPGVDYMHPDLKHNFVSNKMYYSLVFLFFQSNNCRLK